MFGSSMISVYRGMSSYRIPAFAVEREREKSCRCMTACGIPAYAISGNHIYDGMTACGIPAFTLD